MVLFSHESCQRAIPNAIDGFKPGQRKVIWTCFKRNDTQKVKVAQLAGSVSGKNTVKFNKIAKFALCNLYGVCSVPIFKF